MLISVNISVLSQTSGQFKSQFNSERNESILLSEMQRISGFWSDFIEGKNCKFAKVGR